MVAPLLLVGFAVLVATVGSGLLAGASWPDRSPRLGILTWQAISWSTVSAAVLAGAALAVPAVPITPDIAALFSACAAVLKAQYATPGGAALSATGTVLAAAALFRVGYCLLTVALNAMRDRRRQVRGLTMTARRHESSDALVVDHGSAAAYCLPGRSRRIVLTTGALAALDDDQLQAVLAHERAHLRGRHHLVVGAATALQRAFPRVPVFGVALDRQRRLVEMLADDHASRGQDRITVATALVRLAEASAPVAALGAGGTTSVARVTRLLSPPAPLAAPLLGLGALGVAALVLTPVLVMTAPALAVAAAGICPVDLPVQSL